jgi:cell division protein FtsB
MAATTSTRRAPARPNLAAIHWDRAARFALLAVLALLLFLYVGPARSYLHARGESQRRNAEVQRLQGEYNRLEARRRALSNDAVLEREARRLGYVRPGERSYVIEDLPK